MVFRQMHGKSVRGIDIFGNYLLFLNFLFFQEMSIKIPGYVEKCNGHLSYYPYH